MSVVNITFADDRIHVLTDTLQYLETEPAGLCHAKCHVSTSKRWAVAGRGQSMALDWLNRRILALPDIEAAAQFFAATAMPEFFREDRTAELFLFGPVGDRLTVRHMRREGDQFTADRELPHGIHLAPASAPIRAAIAASGVTWADDNRMRRLALAQFKAKDIAASDWRCCIGGTMHMTRITASGAEREVFDLYPDYEIQALTFGDPAADEVIAWRANQSAAA